MTVQFTRLLSVLVLSIAALCLTGCASRQVIEFPANHPVLGEQNLLSQALNLTGTPEPDKIRLPTPELGEHTDEILAEIGYDKDAVETFHASGAV